MRLAARRPNRDGGDGRRRGVGPARQALRTGISFRDWMAACLYDPQEGYYTRQRRVPRTGPADDSDFATSPTLHPFMAECVAREALAAREALGRPQHFAVAEFGGGLGDLARDALRFLEQQGRRPEWIHIEASPGHREAQAGPGIRHADGLPADFVGVVVAHEFLDALPVHLLRWEDGGWSELWVEGEPPRLVGRPPAAAAVAAAPPLRAVPGQVVAANAEAMRWLADVGHTMRAGRVLVIDYGAEGERLWHRDPEWGTVRTFARHGDAGSPLEGPGAKDITASIDFAQLRTWAAEAGLDEAWLQTQEAFLIEHGALDALNAIDRNTLDGASAYLRLRQMLIPHAGGMGAAFQVALYEKGMG